MSNLIIGTGIISTKLEQELRISSAVKVIAHRNIFMKKKISIPNINEIDKIFFFGINKSNLFKNVLDTIMLIKYLNKQSWHGTLIFFSTQQSLKRTFTNNLRLNNQGYYGFIKSIQNFLIKRLSKFKNLIIYLPYVIDKDNSWDIYFKNIALSKELYLPNFGENKLAICNLEQLAKYISLNNIHENSLFLYSNIISLKELLRIYSQNKQLNIFNIDISSKEKFKWNIKNSLPIYIIRIFKDLISLNKIKVYDNENVSYKDTFRPNTEELVNFSSSINLNSRNIIIRNINE